MSDKPRPAGRREGRRMSGDPIARLAAARASFRIALADATAGEGGSAALFQEAAEEMFSASTGFAEWCSSAPVEEFAARKNEIVEALA